jgi:hypothetical protein
MKNCKRKAAFWLAALVAPGNELAPSPSRGPKLERVAQNRGELQAYDNYDLTGSSLRGLSGLDLQQCLVACQSGNKCEAYSFDKLNKQCFFGWQSLATTPIDRPIDLAA